jgi:hypothetical protein
MVKRVRKTTPSVFQLRVTLKYVEPAIWRRLLVPADITLGKLHFVLNEVMGWTDSHLHSFGFADRKFGDPQLDDDGELDFEDERKVKLAGLVRTGQSLRYDYDFGDSWVHEVLVEKQLEADERLSYPLCIGGARACPPEDCGGVPGYERLVGVLANSDDDEHDELVSWVGGHFDPEGFDVNRTNHALHAIARGR